MILILMLLKNKEAQASSGATFTINIHGLATAVSTFNDLVRTPLELYLKKNPQKQIIFLIDGLDESAEENFSDSIISILWNLQSLNNVYFIMTTRDYDNILNKFNKNSLILDISSNKYINYINNDVSTFINLSIKKRLAPKEYQERFTEDAVGQLVNKAEGNFLYIKFVMDAIVEGKIGFSEEEINGIPSSLFGMYNSFFDRMVSQYGEDKWNVFYIPIIRTLLVSFEGLDSDQLSFFTGIEDNLQEILIDLKPFNVVQKLSQSTGKHNVLKYKLYHQSLVEFLKKEYFDDASLNSYYISEQRGHKKIVEKYYDKSKDTFKIELLKRYGLRYLPEHLFDLFDYDDPEGIDWYKILINLARNEQFKEEQQKYFSFETDLPLKTVKRAYEASLEKDDPVSTAEMLLLYAYDLKKIFLESPLSILRNTSLDNNYIIEKAWRIADFYDKKTRIKWYLLIAWYLDSKNNMTDTQRTLDRLIEDIDIINDSDSIIYFCVYSLYKRYKDSTVRILNYLSNDDIYKISLFFFKNNNLEAGLEILNHVRIDKAEINDSNGLQKYRSEALYSIAQFLSSI